MQFRENMRIGQRPKRVMWSKIIIVAVAIIALLAVLGAGYTYWALAPMRSAESRVEKIVHQKTDLVNLNQITVDYRDQTTYAVVGENAKGQQKVAIVQDSSQKVRTFPRSDGMSNQQLTKLLNDRYQPKRIYAANISYFKGVPVWEVSYTGDNGRLNYLTLDFKTGKAYRVINGL